MPPKVDMIDNQYGRLVVLEPVYERDGGHIVYWCECDCGSYIRARGDLLRNGKVTSCGCRAYEWATGLMEPEGNSPPRIITGLGFSRGRSLMIQWRYINQVCHNEDQARYIEFGGAGVIVCPEWHEGWVWQPLSSSRIRDTEGYQNFRQWAVETRQEMQGRQDAYPKLVRIDKEGDFEPDNCKWGSPRETI